MTSLSELGEFGLIRRIAESLPPPPPEVIVGIGDDVAVLRTSGNEYLLATCDVQVENVHFIRSAVTPFQLGRKIVAINVSDIAATGGTPLWALVSLVLPPDIETAFVDGLYGGMRLEMEKAGAAIVGGNLSRTRTDLVVDFSLLGKVSPGEILLRSGARAGDLICITGTVGDSRAGLEILLHPRLAVSEQSRDHVRARHLTPQARLQEGRVLARSGLVHAMADVSDGLVQDMRHICRASGAGAELWADELPVTQECREVSTAAGVNVFDWVLTGGEDYELLFTVAAESAHEVQKIVKDATGTGCHVIGKMLDQRQGVRVMFGDGTERAFPEGPTGWDHFAGMKKDS